MAHLFGFGNKSTIDIFFWLSWQFLALTTTATSIWAIIMLVLILSLLSTASLYECWVLMAIYCYHWFCNTWILILRPSWEFLSFGHMIFIRIVHSVVVYNDCPFNSLTQRTPFIFQPFPISSANFLIPSLQEDRIKIR